MIYSLLHFIGRTFPTHAHFIPRLGSGQISLFNMLTAYSQLDDEVGYCQGLSFVAGVLLMHVGVSHSFECLFFMNLFVGASFVLLEEKLCLTTFYFLDVRRRSVQMLLSSHVRIANTKSIQT